MGKLLVKSDPVSQFLLNSGLTNNVDAAHPANGDPDHFESLLVTNLNHIITARPSTIPTVFKAFACGPPPMNCAARIRAAWIWSGSIAVSWRTPTPRNWAPTISLWSRIRP